MTKLTKPLKIAIASSGLGYVRRGIETWAEDLFLALQQSQKEVALFQGGGQSSEGEPRRHVLQSPPRTDPRLMRQVNALKRFGGWRYGFGSGYEAEQTRFALRLWRWVRRDYDIVNVQDPQVAFVMERLRRAGLSRPQVILAHGTEEDPARLRRYSCLQHLAPCYLEPWQQHAPTNQKVFAIPNFVNTEVFQPRNPCEARALWNLPQNALIVLCVAAIKKQHKRVDYLLHEFDAFSREYGKPCLLVVAGAREEETDDVIREGRQLLGERVRFLEGVSRDRIPTLFNAADMFALASLHEMMPIALLEALASGLPIVCNDTPTLRWMAGPAGNLNDIRQEGALTAQLRFLTDPETRLQMSRAARKRAETTFSEAVVVKQYVAMYEEVAAHKGQSG